MKRTEYGRLGIVGSFLVVALGCLGARAQVQQAPTAAPDASKLTIERIFKSREFAPERFGPARWMKDGRSYATLEPSKSVKDGDDIVLYRATDGRRSILVPAERLVPPGADKPLSIEDYAWSEDGRLLLVFTNSKRVWRRNTRGDYWILDVATAGLRKLGKDFEPSSLMFAKLSPDGRKAAYARANNIFVETLADGAIVQITRDGSDTIINGTSDWVYEEEFNLRDGFRWSPDGRFIAFWRFDTSGVPIFSMINNTDELYPRVISFRHPKPGEPNAAVRIGVVSAAGGEIVWMKAVGDPQSSYIPVMEWAPDGGAVVLQHLNRLQNENRVMTGDIKTGEVRTFFTDQDDAWVDIGDDFRWAGKGKGFVWLSERDGWRHAYLAPLDGKDPLLLTPGDYDVIGLDGIDEKGGWVYFSASPQNATQRYLFRTRLDGKGRLERISPATEPGSHGYDISPSAEWAFHTYSRFGLPPRTELVLLPGHKAARVLAANAGLAAKVDGLERGKAEFVRVGIGDDVELDGWRILPPGFDPSKKYPLLIHVYGEPAGQTVLDRWGGLGYLWHLMLSQKGYIVASFDNRGTPAPRGRAWRKSIYRQVGILASADQAAAVRTVIKDWPGVDPERIGVWGWSGGGTMTLNALLRYPDLYRTGIAVAFVSNQRYYDSIYQERYMGLPKDNEAGYRDGSPITFAKNLNGNLLLIHGTGDDNVHYQNCEALINELVRFNRTFSMMAYPNRSHGITEGENTTLHLYGLMLRFLQENLEK
ncbi:MAG: S9 family peptidase [Candidatus Aminicenantes bacterium]|nr:S9 family peptidase [Candidatus Aminicenantes bacterium]